MKKPIVKNQRMVVYVRRQQLDFFVPKSGSVFSLPISPEVSSDLQISKTEEYKKSVGKILAQHKVEKQKVLIVLAQEICFIKPILPVAKSSQPDTLPADEEQLKQLRESMPFASVYARVIKVAKGQSAVAISRDFFEPLLEILTEQEYEVTTLIPELVAGMDITGQGLTVEIGKRLSAEVGRLEEFDFLESTDKPKQFITTTATPAEKKRTWMLALVFIGLLVVLAVVYWYMTAQEAKERLARQQPAAPPVVQPIAVEVPALATPTPVTTPEVASGAANQVGLPLTVQSASDSGLPGELEKPTTTPSVQGVATSSAVASRSASPLPKPSANPLSNSAE